MPEPEALPEDAPPVERRGRIVVMLALAVLVQVLVPLTYYLRDDRYDERFAWRMFSAIRIERCEATAVESRDGRETTLTLSRVVHSAWEQHLERHRRAVIERFLEERCALGATHARIVNTCVDASGSARPDVRYERECSSGALTVTGR